MSGEWPIVKLGTVTDIKIGGTPSRERSEFWAEDGTGLPWVSISDLKRREVGSTHETITVAGARRSNTKLVPAGTVLMSFKLSIGRVAYSSTDLYTNEAIAAFYPAAPLLAKEWLYHLLPRVSQSNDIDQAIKGATLNKHKLNQLQLPLPPLPEQRRIAEVLDTLDRTIEGTQRVIEKLQAARQGLLHDLLTRGLDEYGQFRDPERNPEQFKDTELGRLPVEWVLMSVAETAAPTPGSTVIGPFGSNLVAADYRDAGTPVVFVRDLKEEGFAWKSDVYVDARKAKELQAHSIQPGDVVVTKMGDPPCLACVFPHSMPSSVMTADIIRISVDMQRVDARWLVLYINSSEVKRQVRWITGGVTRSKVTLKDFRQLTVAVPTLPEQHRILDVVSGSMRKIQAEVTRLAKLQALKRGLMDDLLTGRVRVPVAEHQVEDNKAASGVHAEQAAVMLPSMSVMPPPVPIAAQHRALYRASAGAKSEAMSDWTRQLCVAVQGQQVGPYSHSALDAALPELLAASADLGGIMHVPDLLARAGVRFMLAPHPKGSRTSGAAFYLDETARTQPVVGLSLRTPYLDIFWFNLMHELAHIRLGHSPVADESLERGEHDPNSDTEREAHAQARQWLIPEAMWQPFLAGGQHDRNRIKRFAGRLGRHPAIVAGRLGNDTGDWERFNQPELRPQIGQELRALAGRLSP